MNSASEPPEGVREISPVRGLMFDLDGTLLLSDRSLGAYDLLPGAADTLLALKQRRVPFAVLTNGSAYAPAEQAARLRSAGLPVDDEQMFTPSSVAADHMVRHGIRRVLILGSRGVGQALRDAGVETTQTGDARAERWRRPRSGLHPECRAGRYHPAFRSANFLHAVVILPARNFGRRAGRCELGAMWLFVA